jgi:hypothetical protein
MEVVGAHEPVAFSSRILEARKPHDSTALSLSRHLRTLWFEVTTVCCMTAQKSRQLILGLNEPGYVRKSCRRQR